MLRLSIWLCLMAPKGVDKCWRSQAPKPWFRSETETLQNSRFFFYFCGNLIRSIPHYFIFRCLREHLVLMPKKPHVNLQGIFCAHLCLRICWVRIKKKISWSHVMFFFFFYHVYLLKLEVCYRSGLQRLWKADWSRACGAGGGLLRHYGYISMGPHKLLHWQTVISGIFEYWCYVYHPISSWFL